LRFFWNPTPGKNKIGANPQGRLQEFEWHLESAFRIPAPENQHVYGRLSHPVQAIFVLIQPQSFIALMFPD